MSSRFVVPAEEVSGAVVEMTVAGLDEEGEDEEATSVVVNVWNFLYSFRRWRSSFVRRVRVRASVRRSQSSDASFFYQTKTHLPVLQSKEG